MPEPLSPSAARSTLTQFFRYVLVGGGAFIVDFGTLALLHKGFGLHYLVAAALAFLAGMLANYIVSVSWVFDQRRVKRQSVELGLFALVGVIGLGINQLVLLLLTGQLGIDALLAKLVSAALVLGWNFGARKLLLF